MRNPIPEEHLNYRNAVKQNIQSLSSLQCRVMMAEVMEQYEGNLENKKNNPALNLLSQKWHDMANKASSPDQSADINEMRTLAQETIQTISTIFPDQDSLKQDGQFFRYVRSFLHVDIDKYSCAKIMQHCCDYINVLSQCSPSQQTECFKDFPPSKKFQNCPEGTLERIEFQLQELVNPPATLPLITAHQDAMLELTKRFENSVQHDYESHLYSQLEFILGIKTTTPSFSPESQMLLCDTIAAYQDYHILFKRALKNQLFMIDDVLQSLQEAIAPGEFFIEQEMPIQHHYANINRALTQFQEGEEGFLHEQDGDILLDHGKVMGVLQKKAQPIMDHLASFNEQHPQIRPQQHAPRYFINLQKQLRANPHNQECIDAMQKTLKETYDMNYTAIILETMWMAKQNFLGASPLLASKVQEGMNPTLLQLKMSELETHHPNQRNKIDNLRQTARSDDERNDSITSAIAQGSTTQEIAGIIAGISDYNTLTSVTNDILHLSSRDMNQLCGRADLNNIITTLSNKEANLDLVGEELAPLYQQIQRPLAYRLIRTSLCLGKTTLCDDIMGSFPLSYDLFAGTNIFAIAAKKNSKDITDFVFETHDASVTTEAQKPTKLHARLRDTCTETGNSILCAITQDNAYFLRKAIESGVTPKKIFSFTMPNNETSAHLATRYNAKDILSLMTKNGVDIVAPSYGVEFAPIQHAIVNNNMEIISLLINTAQREGRIQDLNKSAKFDTLIGTINCHNSAILDALMTAGVKLAQDTPNHLLGHIAAKMNAYQCIPVLKKHNIRFDSLSSKQETALHVAIANNNAKSLAAFIQEGAPLVSQDKPDLYIESILKADIKTQNALFEQCDQITKNNIFHQYALLDSWPTISLNTKIPVIHQALTQENKDGLTPIALALKENKMHFIAQLKHIAQRSNNDALLALLPDVQNTDKNPSDRALSSDDTSSIPQENKKRAAPDTPDNSTATQGKKTRSLDEKDEQEQSDQITR